MRVTVIFPDNTIGIDGDFRQFASVNPDEPNWRVIQWYGTYGNIEVYQGEGIWLDTIDLVEPYMANGIVGRRLLRLLKAYNYEVIKAVSKC